MNVCYGRRVFEYIGKIREIRTEELLDRFADSGIVRDELREIRRRAYRIHAAHTNSRRTLFRETPNLSREMASGRYTSQTGTIHVEMVFVGVIGNPVERGDDVVLLRRMNRFIR